MIRRRAQGSETARCPLRNPPALVTLSPRFRISPDEDRAMSRKLIIAVGLVSGLAYAAPALAKDPAGKTFITKAIQGNLAEVQMGQLAQEKSQNSEVKAFGQQLVTDHNDANSKATAVAKDIGVTPPEEPSKKQQADYDKLSKLSGDVFDKQFTKHMVTDHKKDISDYKADSKKKDPTASYASDTLPTLQKHLEMAQSLTKSVGGK
jgi:putative membrane protein